MFKKLWIYSFFALMGILLLLFFLLFQFQKPNLPDTELEMIDLTGFQESAQLLMSNSIDEPAEIALKPRQFSYLAENNHPSYQRYGFVLKGLHYESSGNFGRFRASLKGPFGIWLRVDWTGEVNLNENDTWNVSVNTLWAGNVPLHLVFPAKWSPDWPTTFNEGRVQLHELTLDDRGLRTRLNHSGLSLDIPGIEKGSNWLEKGLESVKDLF